MCERIIIFTKFPYAGEVKTRLIPTLGSLGAAKLQKEMTLHCIQWARIAVEQSKAELEVRFAGGYRNGMFALFGRDLSYREQGAGDLGRRLERAFYDSFEEGINRSIVVGADCPMVTAEVMCNALQVLRSKQLVLGPAVDGGYYLIGLSRPIPHLFRDIPWGTSRVLNKTLERARTEGISLQLLETSRDVDVPEDLSVWEDAKQHYSPKEKLHKKNIDKS